MKHWPARLILLGGLLPLLLRGATDPYLGGTWTFLDAPKAIAAASEITTTSYPNCQEATVDEKIVEVYRPDGTAQTQDEAFVKVLTEEGKRGRRKLAWSFELPYDEVKVVKLEVIKPTGAAVATDLPANSSITIDSSQMAENIYDPNDKVLEVNVPDLEIGDVLHWVVRDTTLRPIIPGEFADENNFEGDGYIRHLVYEVHAPLAKPLKRMVLRDEIPGTVHYSERPGGQDTLVHRWEVAGVPRMFAEASMPPYENAVQRVRVSTMSDWREVSQWYWNLSKPHLDAATPELKQTVARLTAGAKTDPEKMKALFYFVSQNIRYMGLTPEKDRPGFEPHDVGLTYAKKYGVCRDKAALLVSMLRTAGLKAYPVLVSVGSKKDKEVPDAGFNHAIAGVELTKGVYTLMDPTDEHARDLLPFHDGDQSYLVCRPEGEDILLSAANPPEDNLMRIRTTGTLTAAGGLQATSELSFDGANDDVYRNKFSRLKPDDRRRFFEDALKKAIPGATLQSLTLTPENMLDVSKPIKAEMVYSADGMTASGSGKSVVSVPWIGGHFGLVNYLLDGLGLAQRKYPLQTRLACGVSENISLQLGAGFEGADSMPACAPVESDGLSYRRSDAVKDGRLECSRELKLKSVEFSPGQYAALKQTLKDLAYDSRKSPILASSKDDAAAPPPAAAGQVAMAPVNSNAVVLSSEKNLQVIDAHSAVFRVKYAKRILTYAGKIREAEVKLSYNPSCQTVRFIHGTVVSNRGERQEISANEINVMDEPWNGSAKRYTGGKILVANLPGVDIGSTIEVEYEMTMRDRPYIAGFEAFQLGDDLAHKSFDLSAAAGVPVKTLVTAGDSIHPATVTAASGAPSFRWTTDNMKAMPAETDVPPQWAYLPGVTYFAGDFRAYLKTLSDTLETRSGARAQVEQLLPQIVSPQRGDLENVRAIRDFVAKTIREAGPSFTELPLSELSRADTTLADGYGHAADRAILLHAMLSGAGFRPEFVLASDVPALPELREKSASFPLPDNFTALLVKVTLHGQAYYLNDTDQYAQLGTTAHDDRMGINLADQSYGVVQAPSDCENKTETTYALTFAGDGSVLMGITKSYYGNDYDERNRALSEMRPEERKRYFQELVSSIAQGARPVGDLTSRFDVYPGTLQFTVKVDNYAVVDGDHYYFGLPFVPSLHQLPEGDQRRLPLLLSEKAERSFRTEIELPPGFSQLVVTPKSESLGVPAEGGLARTLTTTEPGKIVLTDDFQTWPALIRPPDYPAVVNVESLLERKSAGVFLLDKDGGKEPLVGASPSHLEAAPPRQDHG